MVLLHRWAAFGLTCALALPAAAGYDKPPQPILDVMRAPSPPAPLVSPDGRLLLLVARQDYPPIERVATPFLRLAGTRVEIANHSKHDTPAGYGIAPCARSIDVVRVADGNSTALKLPAGCVDQPLWSADGRHFAFANAARDTVQLWVGDARSGALRRIDGVRLNPMFEQALQWMPDGRTLLVKTVPAGLGKPPAAPAVPPGPRIQQTGGDQGESSTYELRDTLQNTHDEDLFDHYGAAQLALVDTAAGSVRTIGAVGNHDLLLPAPDGRHLLVTTIRKPYSYVTTYDRFPHDVTVWDLSRRPVAVTPIVSLPLADRVPIHGVATGPRGFEWRPTDAATLVWTEALDGGNWKTSVPQRDRLMLLKAPFSGAAVELMRTEQRLADIVWGERADTALLYEYDHNKLWRRSFVFNADEPQTPPRLLWSRSSSDRYGAPGTPVQRTLGHGVKVLRQDGDAIFLSGPGASADGDRPFLDRFDLKTLKSERLFRSDKTAYEQFLAFEGDDTARWLTWHQSITEPPNAWLRTPGAAVAADAGEAVRASQRRAVTHLVDTAPAVRAIERRLVRYKRADGLDLSFTLYTPPGYVAGMRLPTILYAYPLDYADAAAAGQVRGSQMMFVRLRQYRLLLLAGYAIIDNASFPIVGDPRKAYDDYLPQLVADARAAVDEAVRLGVADPERIGVTGHSHGALMTVNLLAHSDLFRAGVASSGSYNKTLTPFGFQNERRTLWQAGEVYRNASPFFFADRIKSPLLLVHGADDANPGTTPLQSQRMYEALRGNGATARLVMLPYEPHWYTALESNEQFVAEMVNWFDTYVKNAPPRAAAAAKPAP